MSSPASGSPQSSSIEQFGPLLQVPDQLSQVQRSIDELKDLMQKSCVNLRGQFPSPQHPYSSPLDLPDVIDVSEDDVGAKHHSMREPLRHSLMVDRGSSRRPSTLGQARNTHALGSAPLIKGRETTPDVHASSEPPPPYVSLRPSAPCAKHASCFTSVLPGVTEDAAEGGDASEITKPTLSQTPVKVCDLEDQPGENESSIGFQLRGLPNAVTGSDADNGSDPEAPGQPCEVEAHEAAHGGGRDGGSQSSPNEQRWSLGGYRREDNKPRRISLSSIGTLRRKATFNFASEASYAGWLNRSIYMIAPDAPFRAAFDVFLLICIAFLAFWAPLQLAYERQRMMQASSLVGFYIADVVMILDVLLGFCTGKETEDGRLEMDPDIITNRYLRSWFCVDFLAACPISFAQDPAADMYVAFRCFKIAKFMKFPHVLSNLQRLVNGSAVSYLKMFLPLLITAHVMACCWQLIRQQDSWDNAQPLLVEEYGFEFYLQDIYWVVMTMTSVGYGDIVPTGAAGRIFATAVMLLSSAYCGFVVSTTQQVVKNLYDDGLEKQVRDASGFMHRRHVTTELQKRVEHCVRQQVRREQSLAFAPRLLEKLSRPMQRELSLQLLAKVIVQFPLFRGAQSSYVAQLAHAHIWLLALGGDLVVQEGEVVQEMVFVVQGKLLCLIGTGSSAIFEREDHYCEEVEEGAEDMPEKIQDTWFETGAWFGERCLFVPGEARQYTMIADSDAELAMLEGSEYKRVTELYPKLWLRHQELVRQTQLGQMSLHDLAYRPTEKEEEGIRHCFSGCCFSSCFKGKLP